MRPDHWSRSAPRWLSGRLASAVGGPARRRVVVLLACALALDGADLGTIGATAAELEKALKIDNIELGLLVSLPLLVAAAATIPIGGLSDRLPRIRLLGGSVVLWSLGMFASGASVSFEMLLISRLFLGAVQATSGPTLFSLTGDFFPARERARMWGFISAGELLGTAFGFIVSGALAAISWRLAFFVLAIPTLGLAFALWRLLPEPARGGQSELHDGDEEIVSARQAQAHASERDSHQAPEREDTLAERVVAARHVEPDPQLILRVDPNRMSLWSAVRYVLRIRTNVTLIIASALGYFFVGGAETFGQVFIRGHYSLGQTEATGVIVVLGIGALTGVILSGRIADRLLRAGHINARVVVAAIGYIAAAGLFVLPLAIHSLAIALPLLLLAAAGLASPQPPLDAARLDTVPARLWGRAEGIRTALRTLATASAPLLFGLVAEQFGASSSTISAAGSGASSGGVGGATGLEYTFLIMLIVILIAGLNMLRATRTYPRDLATAIASDHSIRAAGEAQGFAFRWKRAAEARRPARSSPGSGWPR